MKKVQEINGKQSLLGIKTLRSIKAQRQPIHVRCLTAFQNLFSFMGRMHLCDAQDHLKGNKTETPADTRVFVLNDFGKWKITRGSNR